MNKTVAKPRNKLNIIQVRVCDAYFAKRIDEPEYEKTQEEYIVKSGDTLSKIAKTKATTVNDLKKVNSLTSDTIQLKQKLKITTKIKKGSKVTFKEINTANLGEEVYVVVSTSNFQGKKIWLNVRQGKEQGIDTENCAIQLSDNDKEFYRPEAVVGAYANESKITNSNDFKDWAIFKFKIGGNDTRGYADALEKLTNKKTKLCLIIDAHNPNGIPSNHVGYEGYDGKLDYSEEPNCWLDEDGKWFELGLGENKKAPWMEIALKEYNRYKTKRENESPLKEKIIDHYHKSTVLGAAHYGKETQWGDDTSWCASFINWCFNQLEIYKDTNKNPKKYYNSQAYSWKHENWKNGDKSEPFYGAVAVTNFSHTGFVVGKSKTGKIVILGGNQDGAQKRTLKERICFTAIDKTAIISYAKPKGYEPSESEKKLSIIDITASDNFLSTR